MRTALIGGASKGLGFACAQELARAGHRVVMCARDKENLATAAKAIRENSSSEVIEIPCDLSQKADLEMLRERLAHDNIHVDILINNTGGPAPGKVTEIQESDWQKGLDLLFWSTVRLYEMVLPGMREKKWGRIVNILSTVVVEPVSTLAVSSVLRSALASYAKLTAQEVAKDGVTVNSLMPGGYLTERTMELMKDTAKREGKSVEEVRAGIESTLPQGRFLDPKELGAVVASLTRDDAAGVTGALIHADGSSPKSL